MLHRCYLPIDDDPSMATVNNLDIVHCIFSSFFFGGVAHSTRSSRKSFHQKTVIVHFVIFIFIFHYLASIVSLSLSAFHLFVSDCMSFCVLFCARLRNNKVPGHNAHNFLFNNSNARLHANCSTAILNEFVQKEVTNFSFLLHSSVARER